MPSAEGEGPGDETFVREEKQIGRDGHGPEKNHFSNWLFGGVGGLGGSAGCHVTLRPAVVGNVRDTAMYCELSLRSRDLVHVLFISLKLLFQVSNR